METFLSIGSKVFTDILANMELIESYMRKGGDCSAMA